MSVELETAGSVDLLLFEVGDRTYGADATQVLRIDRDFRGEELEALGRLRQAGRSLVFRTEAGEARLAVDAVRGVRKVEISGLRRKPKVVGSHPAAIGFWLDGDTPVVLIDLVKTQESQERD